MEPPTRHTRSQQQHPVQLEGSTFTIKNILNLPDEQKEGTGQIQSPVGLKATPACPPSRENLTREVGPLNKTDDWSRYIASYMKLGLAGLEINFPAMGPHLSLAHVARPEFAEFRRCNRSGAVTKRREHHLFSALAVQNMEKEFNATKYLTRNQRTQLALRLKITETQVKTWFQNRRTKWRKELRNGDPPIEVPDGRLRSSLKARA